ncbi:hypothetical protein IHE45_07G014700 [Dioscorea alata]|uniref:Uncharacterized protein n=2 Tax=Dioscorea alata TaxID=55571 RepID=A0ACB7VPG1_DIOAL|nr:hypothetical protein IHE45_07G014700 [Dioscorea alata]KAH7676425.1 hypothetical protein IHE45_07G014700 [Dioscorea alata]
MNSGASPNRMAERARAKIALELEARKAAQDSKASKKDNTNTNQISKGNAAALEKPQSKSDSKQSTS